MVRRRGRRPVAHGEPGAGPRAGAGAGATPRSAPRPRLADHLAQRAPRLRRPRHPARDRGRRLAPAGGVRGSVRARREEARGARAGPRLDDVAFTPHPLRDNRRRRAPMNLPIRRIAWPGVGEAGWETLLSREWLVTNGLGGYASGTVCGIPTWRFHGLLIAALPAPLGRTMMLNHLTEELRLPDGSEAGFGGEERDQADPRLPSIDYLSEFRLEGGLPV